MLIQIILIVIIAIIVWRLAVKLKTKEITVKQFSGWLLIWLAAVVIVAWPDVTALIANSVGVGRGSDLVIYLSVIFLFYSIFRLLLRIEKLEKNLTKVVRQEAIKDYDRK
jgi:small membrane protein